MVQEGEMALSINDTTTLSPQPTEVWEINNNAAAPDSIMPHISEPEYGLLLTPPEPPEGATPRNDQSLGISFILTGLFLLFLIISLRFRHNVKYALTMFRNLVETKTRHNVFDDTVRETSLIVMLNVLWCASAGIVAYCMYKFCSGISEGPMDGAGGMLWGMAIAGVYSVFMWWAYAAVGWVFSDRSHSALWVKGYSASQALMAPAFFLTALVAICRPEGVWGAGMAAAGVFIIVKLIFIWKGYRIFFNQISSWVLFLCYLCSLEIVPLILCYRLALLLDKML